MNRRAAIGVAALSLAGVVAAGVAGVRVGHALRRADAGVALASVPSAPRPPPRPARPLVGLDHRLDLRIIDLPPGWGLPRRQTAPLREHLRGCTGVYIALAREVGTLSRQHATESHGDWRARLDRRISYLRALLQQLVSDGRGDLLLYGGPHRLLGWVDRYVGAARRAAEDERALRKVVMFHNGLSQWNDESGAALGYVTPTSFPASSVTLVRPSILKPGRWFTDSVIRIDAHEDLEPLVISCPQYARWVYRNAQGRYQELKVLADVAAEHGLGLVLYGKSLGPRYERSPYRDDFNQVVRMEAYLEHAAFPVIVGHARNADPHDEDATIHMLGQDRRYAIIDVRDTRPPAGAR